MEAQASSRTRTNIILINNGQKTGDTNQQQQGQGQPIKNGPPTNILPSNPGALVYPEYNPYLNYYQEFWRLYLQNEVVIGKIRETSFENKEIQAQVARLKDLIRMVESNYPDIRIKKKQRRKAVQINKNCKCPYEKCNKSYGSEVSLNLHIKLKHNGGNKSEREQLAKKIYVARVRGETAPEVGISFPPGYLEVE